MFLAKHIINRDMAIIKRYSNTIVNIPTSYHRETKIYIFIFAIFSESRYSTFILICLDIL